jgi:hypothetical protein
MSAIRTSNVYSFSAGRRFLVFLFLGVVGMVLPPSSAVSSASIFSMSFLVLSPSIETCLPLDDNSSSASYSPSWMA